MASHNYVIIGSNSGLWLVRRYPILAWSNTDLLFITVTSQWAPWRPKSLASRLFAKPFVQAHIKQNIKALRHWTLWGGSTGDQRTPVTRKCLLSSSRIIKNKHQWNTKCVCIWQFRLQNVVHFVRASLCQFQAVLASAWRLRFEPIWIAIVLQ